MEVYFAGLYRDYILLRTSKFSPLLMEEILGSREPGAVKFILVKSVPGTTLKPWTQNSTI